MRTIILAAIFAITSGCCNAVRQEPVEFARVGKFRYLDSLVGSMSNVTDFSKLPEYQYATKTQKDMYELVLKPAFCTKVLGLPEDYPCKLDIFTTTEALQEHTDAANYNVIPSFLLNIVIRSERHNLNNNLWL